MFFHHLCSAGLAALALLLACGFSDRRVAAHQTEHSLLWARQISSQVEAMSLRGRELRERDPVRWAVHLLSQGVEPRKVTLTQVQGIQSPQQDASFRLDRAAGVFEYIKMISPENTSGVKIRIEVPFEGFLGTRSRLANDLLAILFFSCLYAIAMLSFYATLFMRRYTRSESFKSDVLQWIDAAKAALTQMGSHIREMIRCAQKLALACAQSQAHVSALRSKTHEGLSAVHKSGSDLKEALRLIKEGESLAQTALQGGHQQFLTSDFLDFTRKLHALVERGQWSCDQLEKQLEPWVMDADQAFHANSSAEGASLEMAGHIRKTIQSILDYNLKLRAAKSQWDAQEPQAHPPSGPESEPQLGVG